MKKIILILLIGYSINSFSQSKSFLKYNGSDTSLEILNKGKFDSLLNAMTTKAGLLIVYTNLCKGTPFALREVNRLHAEYGSKLLIILASSSHYKDIPELKQVLSKYNVALPKTYFIDSELYKDSRLDDRKKGFLFRNDICEACKDDIIGVPYTIVFDNQKQVALHGYPKWSTVDSAINYFIYK